jgi:hypothetical protein
MRRDSEMPREIARACKNSVLAAAEGSMTTSHNKLVGQAYERNGPSKHCDEIFQKAMRIDFFGTCPDHKNGKTGSGSCCYGHHLRFLPRRKVLWNTSSTVYPKT